MNLEQLKNKIESLEFKNDFKNIFKIIYENEPTTKYIINENGVFIKMNLLNKETIELINKYINSIEPEIIKIDDIKQYYKNEDKEYNKLTSSDKKLLKKNIKLEI